MEANREAALRADEHLLMECNTVFQSGVFCFLKADKGYNYADPVEEEHEHIICRSGIKHTCRQDKSKKKNSETHVCLCACACVRDFKYLFPVGKSTGRGNKG